MNKQNPRGANIVFNSNYMYIDYICGKCVSDECKSSINSRVQFCSHATFCPNRPQYVLTAFNPIGCATGRKTISANRTGCHSKQPDGKYLIAKLAKLQTCGIIGSRRGANGGVYIAKPLKNIRLIDIIITLEGDAFFRRCFLGIDGCGHIEPCPFHDQWTSHRSEIGKWLSSTTLYDLCNDVNDNWITERLRFNRAEVP